MENRFENLTLGCMVAPRRPVSKDLKTVVMHSSSLSVNMCLGKAMSLQTFRSLFLLSLSSPLFFCSSARIS